MTFTQFFSGKYNVTILETDEFNIHKYEWMRKDIEKYYIKDTDILDIGANIGYTTLLFSDYGPVHSFEPVLYEIVEMNIKNNKLNNHVKLYNFEICDMLDNVYSGVPSIIKINIENTGMNFLMGSKKILETFKPTLFIEIIDLKNSEIPKFLKSLGYKKAPVSRPENMYIFTSNHLSSHLRPCNIS